MSSRQELRAQIARALRNVDLNNCSGISIYQQDGEYLLDDDPNNESPFGVDLEEVETCTMNGATDYLVDCIPSF